MLLTCPNCSTRFVAPDSAIGPDGRRVKCGRCGHIWHARPPEPAAPTEAPETSQAEAPVEAEPVVRPIPPGSNLPAMPRLRRSRAPLGWAVLVVVVAAIVAGLWFGREQIVTTWPKAAKLYALLDDTQVNPFEGLEIREVSSQRRRTGSATVLEISGKVANTTPEDKPMPQLVAALLDSANAEIQSESFPQEGVIPPAGERDFTVVIRNASPLARNVAVTFASDKAK